MKSRVYEHHSISELRLGLTEIARRVQREKVRVVVRRRFDAVAVLLPMDDLELITGANRAAPQHEQIRSIREGRENFASLIDAVLTLRHRYVLQHRGESLAALVSLDDLGSIDPEFANASARAGSAPVTLAAATATQVLRHDLPSSTELIIAPTLTDQNGERCFGNGLLTLRRTPTSVLLSGFVEPLVPANKLMIKVGDLLLDQLTPVQGHKGFYELRETEVADDTEADDLRVVRLA